MRPHNRTRLNDLQRLLSDASESAEVLMEILDGLPPDHSEFHSLHRHIKDLFGRLRRELVDFCGTCEEFDYDFKEREPQWLKDRKAKWKVECEELQATLSKANDT